MVRISLLIVVMIVFWGVQGTAAVDIGYSVDVEQHFSYMGGFDLNDDGNNPISTRGDVGSAAFTNNQGNSSGDSVRWFDTLLAFNGKAAVQGWGADDISLNVRLVSQFDWLGAQTSNDLNSRPTSTGAAAGPYRGTGAHYFGIAVNQAYVKFDDIASLPFDLTVGRQNIWLGKGFVIGSRIFGSGATVYAAGIAPSGSAVAGGAMSGTNGQVSQPQTGNLPLGTSSAGVIHAPQYADFTGFDAVRLDTQWKDYYFNLGYALVATSLTQNWGAHTVVLNIRDEASDNDEYLLFGNLGLNSPKMTKDPWNLEAYWIANIDGEPYTNQQAAFRSLANATRDEIYTFGVRGQRDFPGVWKLKNLQLYGEGSSQYGRLGAAPRGAIKGRHRKAWAANVGIEFSLSGPYTPMLGIEGVEYSGPKQGTIESDDDNINRDDNVQWTVWDPVFRGNHFTMIMDFLDVFYLTDTLAPDVNASIPRAGKIDAGFTNRKLLILKGGFNPSSRVDMGAKVVWAVLSKNAADTPTAHNLGAEIDANIGWKYSDKVRWTLDGGIFLPGGYYSVPTPLGGGGKTDAWIVRTGLKFSI